MQFIGRDTRNHAVVIDVCHELGGERSGPSPSALMLIAASSYAAVDIVDVLKK